MMKKFAAFGVFALAAVACGDASPAEPEPTITRTGSFDLTVERGTQAEWTHRVTLPDSTRWVSADIVPCDEWRAISVHVGPCYSSSLRLEAGVMTFVGTVGGEYTDLVRVHWEATGR